MIHQKWTIRRTISATTLPMFIILYRASSRFSPCFTHWRLVAESWVFVVWQALEKTRLVDSHQIVLYVNMFYILLCTFMYTRIYIYIMIYYAYIDSNPYNIRPRVICQVTNSTLRLGRSQLQLTDHLINKRCLLQILPNLKGFRYKTAPDHSLPNSGQPRVVDNSFEFSCGTFRNDSCLAFVI